MSCNNDIALSRKQKVFAVLEDICGTLQFPNATIDLILPAGNVAVNQTPSFSDSEELNATLDVLNQFQDAKPPAEFSIPMYARPSGTLRTAPQGSPLFQSLQGGLNSSTTASIEEEVTDVAVAGLKLHGIAGGKLPEKGVINIEDEEIYYGTITRATRTSTTATLDDLVRNYSSGAAAAHATGATLSLSSVFYPQDTSSPSFSLWVETDHFVQGVSGCSVNSLSVSLGNTGGLMLTSSGEGMQMIWAGTDALAANAVIATASILVDNGKRFAIGARIHNSTQDHNNSGSGYELTAVNATSGTLTLGTVIEGAWATDDVITGYLPTGTEIGSALESKDTDVELDDTLTLIKSGDLSIGAPKKYLDDEIGTDYPEDFLEEKREITSTLGLYFKKADAEKWRDGYDGSEKSVLLTFGTSAGSTMEIYMKKCKLEVPNISAAAPAMEISIPIKALGTDGEDSLDLCFH